MKTIPDHPDIARALRTGYPHECRTVRCFDCKNDFNGDYVMYVFGSVIFCNGCMRRRISQACDVAPLAKAFEKTTAGKIIYELEY